MGEDVAAQEFSRADRTRHREKIRRNLKSMGKAS